MSELKFEDLEIGQHLWVLAEGKLLMVAKFDDSGYSVCGDWECGIDRNECQIIELVGRPKGFESFDLYYSPKD